MYSRLMATLDYFTELFVGIFTCEHSGATELLLPFALASSPNLGVFFIKSKASHSYPKLRI